MAGAVPRTQKLVSRENQERIMDLSDIKPGYGQDLESPKRQTFSQRMRSVLALGALSLLAASTTALTYSQTTHDSPRGVQLDARNSNGLQNNVTWDQYSLMINGERTLIFSGEFHPYRMPVHSLYLDIFQKIKSAGFNTVSFYTFWGLHEPKRGAGIDFSGFRDVEPFIQAAQQAGIYLIARPGPYINAETTGGGFPGWGLRDPSIWRTSDSSYTNAWSSYISSIGALIAKYQISSGGPIILVQSENEYTSFASGHSEDFTYENLLKTAFRNAGVKVPLSFNDASPSGHYTSVDLWGYDSYPNGFDCSNPTSWGSGAVPTYLWDADRRYAPSGVPNNIYEFQGGSFDGWGGASYAKCAELTGPEFERVFYKSLFSQSVAVLNLYMIYGGTNWGGIAHPGVYTSYDYGSAIAEDRTLREKYYELKLQANFFGRSPAFLTTRPQNIDNQAGAFTGNSQVDVAQTLDVVGKLTGFYTVKHHDASTYNTQTYRLTVPTSKGNLTIPLNGQLSLVGHDSKVHVVDYIAGSTHILYSTGEIATWVTVDGRDVIVIYGNAGEKHETAFVFGSTPSVTTVSGAQVQSSTSNGALVLSYTTSGQSVVQIGSSTLVYFVDRATAYTFWTIYPPTSGANAFFSKANPVLIKGGYLVRTVSTSGGKFAITGDLNNTASFEIIAPAAATSQVTFNGASLSTQKTSYGTLTASKTAVLPDITLPDLQSLTWKSADSLPEIQPSYSDAKWTTADHKSTNNSAKPSTPVVLYSSDYGYHTGPILWRGHFTSSGQETGFTIKVAGGAAFGFNVWLNSTFLGSWWGSSPASNNQQSWSFAKLSGGKPYVVTIVQDHMGYEEDFTAASDSFKSPRGILSYSFSGSNTAFSSWKVTGNLGGEDYVDRTRGPLNEGGLYGERQGWHLPGFDDSQWAAGKPTDGIFHPGVQFYRTSFSLNLPSGIDYPLAVAVSNTTNSHFRAKFFVNGYEFGRYVNAIGPQTSFPVPEGVLNYNGTNSLAVSLWAHQNAGAKLTNLHLELRAKAESSKQAVVNLPATAWTARANAY